MCPPKFCLKSLDSNVYLEVLSMLFMKESHFTPLPNDMDHVHVDVLKSLTVLPGTRSTSEGPTKRFHPSQGKLKFIHWVFMQICMKSKYCNRN